MNNKQIVAEIRKIAKNIIAEKYTEKAWLFDRNEGKLKEIDVIDVEKRGIDQIRRDVIVTEDGSFELDVVFSKKPRLVKERDEYGIMTSTQGGQPFDVDGFLYRKGMDEIKKRPLMGV